MGESIVARKGLVGHRKVAQQCGGLLQSIENGVPVDHNADNVDAFFQQHSSLMFPSMSAQTDGISAGVMVRSH